MGRADNPGGSVGEQHRHAIRRQNAERNARRGRDKGVRRRIVLISPRLVHGDRNGGMDLIDRHQRIGRQAEAIRDPTPIRQHMARIIGGADTAIEPGVEADTDPTGAGEKAVRDVLETIEGGKRDHDPAIMP